MIAGRRTKSGVVLAVAAVLAGAGGSAAGLGAPAWAAGAGGAVLALVAGVMADRGWGRREEHAVAHEQRSQMLDQLREEVRSDRGLVLEMLQAGRSPVPFRGRSRELKRLAAWRDDPKSSPVLMLAGPGGVGKTRLALEFGLKIPAGWVAGWLHAAAGSTMLAAVQACGDPTLILIEDADGRPDLIPLLESLAAQSAGLMIRVVLITRSPEGLRTALERRLEERHAWIAVNAVTLEIEAVGGPDDWERWYVEAVRAFATALHRPTPTISERFIQYPESADEMFAMYQAQALLAVLDQEDGGRDPRDLSFGQVAAAPGHSVPLPPTGNGTSTTRRDPAAPAPAWEMFPTPAVPQELSRPASPSCSRGNRLSPKGDHPDHLLLRAIDAEILDAEAEHIGGSARGYLASFTWLALWFKSSGRPVGRMFMHRRRHGRCPLLPRRERGWAWQSPRVWMVGFIL